MRPFSMEIALCNEVPTDVVSLGVSIWRTRQETHENKNGKKNVSLIRETVKIKASPAAVFELVTRVSDFALYSGVIKEVRLIAGSTYHWTVRVGGITLDWDAVVTECECPKRFAWRSIRGIKNEGAYELQATSEGTQVTFSMNYHLKNSFVEAAVAPLVQPLIHRVSAEILDAVKTRLERN